MIRTKYGIYPYIDKKYILSNIRQEDIFEYYLNIPINKNTLKSSSFKSPFRVDNNPSCNYYYSDNGKLRIKDWSYNIYYDCFDVVAEINSLNSKNTKDFKKILHIIAKDFKLNIYSNEEYVNNFEKNIKKFNLKKNKPKKRNKITQFKVKLRNYNYHDNSYFGKAGLEFNDLKGVYFIQEIYISVNYMPYKLIYEYNFKDPCYGYYGRKDNKLKIDLWKFYFPNRKKGDEVNPKFISNGIFMQGIQYMKPARFCIITKAYKDALPFKKLGIQSCGLAAEGIVPNKKDINFFKNNYDYIFTCLDYDKVGVRTANKLKHKHNFIPIMFTKGLYGQKDFKCKDNFEFCTKNSIKELKNIIKTHYNKNIEYALNFQKEIYNKLKFIK